MLKKINKFNRKTKACQKWLLDTVQFMAAIYGNNLDLKELYFVQQDLSCFYSFNQKH